MSRTRMAKGQLPPMELAILHVLWDEGPSTVQEVQAKLVGNPAYTTVQTILNNMERKGRTSRRMVGKAFVYRSCVARETALRNAVWDLIQRTFQGSVDGLLMNLVRTELLDEKTLERLTNLLAEGAAQSEDIST